MGSGLDTPTSTYAPGQDPILASLHEKLLNSAQADPLRLASSTQDFTPGAPGADNSPGVRVADASSPPNLLDASSPPALVATDARPAPAPAAAPESAAPPAAPPDLSQPARLASDAPTPAAAAPGSTFNYNDAGSSCDDKTICSWKPNANSTSQLTKDWFAAHGTQASAAVDSSYKVKFGDDLEGIARRELKAEGKEGSSVKDEVAKIIRLNHDHYKSLDCNSDLIRTGWTLKLNDQSAAPAAPPPTQSDAAPPPAPAPITSPDACKKDCDADVIVDNPNHETYFNGKKVGDHDRTIIKNGTATEVPITAGDGANGRRHKADVAPVTAPAKATGNATDNYVGDASFPAPLAPAPQLRPVDTTRVDKTLPAAAPAPDSVVAAAPAAALPDTPAPIIPGKVAAPDQTQPVPTATADNSVDDLIPGPGEVQAPAAPTPPPAQRAAVAPAPARPAAPLTQADASNGGNNGFIADGNSLGP